MFQKVIEENLDSAHVFLIICRYGERFTEEDQAVVRHLVDTYGEKVLKEHCIVVATCGDNFVRDTEGENLTFSQWCENQTGAFADLRTGCENRVLSVDNHAKDRKFTDALEAEIGKLNDEEMTGRSLTRNIGQDNMDSKVSQSQPESTFVDVLDITVTGESSTCDTLSGSQVLPTISSVSAVTKTGQRELDALESWQFELGDGRGVVDLDTGLSLDAPEAKIPKLNDEEMTGGSLTRHVAQDKMDNKVSKSEPKTIFIHLLGKTGSGKSSTGNTLLCRKVFPTTSSLSAVTKTIQREQDILGSKPIEVVDGPGVVDLDTGLSQDAFQMFQKVIEENLDSAHVFLIICRYGERFTEEDQAVVRHLVDTYGEKVLKEHCIVVATCGDNFVRDTEGENLTFSQWCENQTGAFADLRTGCENRVLSVDNHAKDRKFTDALEAEIGKLNDEEMTGRSLTRNIGQDNMDSKVSQLQPDKTGTRESSTCDTLSGSKVFSTISRVSDVTETVQREWDALESWPFELVDGPGVVDLDNGLSLDVPEAEITKLNDEEMTGRSLTRHVEQDRMDNKVSKSRPRTIFIHLLGKTGSGKSSTGNTLLRRKVFPTTSSLSAVTKTIQREQGTLGSKLIEVIDGPGVVDLDTGLSKDAFQMFRNIIEENLDSAHVFLIVCRYGERFTEEDQAVVRQLVDTYGEKVLKEHCIVVATCGDNFVRDTEDEKLTFSQWCENQTGAFAELRDQCEKRVLSVDNRAKDGKFKDVLEAAIATLSYEEMTGRSLTRNIEQDSIDSKVGIDKCTKKS
ncbi:GTPase imap family member 6 [Plakobranchus ocellatus]|uniref:GTPase imap family member 6 n=1 Tax=Plakobranchus ocellatus TaxID=259542 RepID=A0AAV3Z6Z6_9GAST|nr:GTPase imap family member 6 [Plakobranchus ocellatus]